MILAIFFKFNRFWSVRNLDLIGLILLTPGLLFLAMYNGQAGYLWMFGIHLAILVRLLFDMVMVRRPLLEPNLTSAGLTFACITLFTFMVANVAINRGEQLDSVRTIRLEQILCLTGDSSPMRSNVNQAALQSPGYAPFYVWVEKTNQVLAPPDSLRSQLLKLRNGKTDTENESGNTFPVVPQEIFPVATPPVLSDGSPFSLVPSSEETKTVSLPVISDTLVLAAVLATHLTIVLGLLFIGHAHFGNIRVGIAAATIYLLHPCTNQMLGRLDHFVPAMLLVWAIAFYRRPLWAGFSIGLAAALVFYPIFLIPLWCGFYWKRGWIRFLCGIGVCYAVFLILLFSTAPNFHSFGLQLANLLGRDRGT